MLGGLVFADTIQANIYGTIPTGAFVDVNTADFNAQFTSSTGGTISKYFDLDASNNTTDLASSANGLFSWVVNVGASNRRQHEDTDASLEILEDSNVRVRIRASGHLGVGQTNNDYNIVWTIYADGMAGRDENLTARAALTNYYNTFMYPQTGYGNACDRNDGDTLACGATSGTVGDNNRFFGLRKTSGVANTGWYNFPMFAGEGIGYDTYLADGGQTQIGFYMNNAPDNTTTRSYTAVILHYAHNTASRIILDDLNTQRGGRARALDFNKNASLSFASGTVNTTDEGDYDADGYNEAEIAYVMNANSNRVDFTLPITDSNRYNPKFKIKNYTGADVNVMVDGNQAVQNVDYWSDINSNTNTLIVAYRHAITNPATQQPPYGAVASQGTFGGQGDGYQVLDTPQYDVYAFRTVGGTRIYSSTSSTTSFSSTEENGRISTTWNAVAQAQGYRIIRTFAGTTGIDVLTGTTIHDEKTAVYNGSSWVSWGADVTVTPTSATKTFADFNILALAGGAPPAPTAIDVNAWAVDGNKFSLSMPSYSYAVDENLTMDFNIRSDLNNVLLDINASTVKTQGGAGNIVIITDLNLSKQGSKCSDLNFENGANCSWDWNIFGVADANYYINVLAKNGSSTDYNSSDRNFRVNPGATPITATNPQPIGFRRGADINLSLNTDVASTCRWADTNIGYNAMTSDFVVTGGTSHTTALTVANGQHRTVYMTCRTGTDTNSNTLVADVFRYDLFLIKGNVHEHTAAGGGAGDYNGLFAMNSGFTMANDHDTQLTATETAQCYRSADIYNSDNNSVNACGWEWWPDGGATSDFNQHLGIWNFDVNEMWKSNDSLYETMALVTQKIKDENAVCWLAHPWFVSGSDFFFSNWDLNACPAVAVYNNAGPGLVNPDANFQWLYVANDTNNGKIVPIGEEDQHNDTAWDNNSHTLFWSTQFDRNGIADAFFSKRLFAVRKPNDINILAQLDGNYLGNTIVGAQTKDVNFIVYADANLSRVRVLDRNKLVVDKFPDSNYIFFTQSIVFDVNDYITIEAYQSNGNDAIAVAFWVEPVPAAAPPTETSIPDVNVVRPDGNLYLGKGLTDWNHVIDFNVSNKDSNNLRAKIYYSTTIATFQNLIADVNLLFMALNPTVDANCLSSRFYESTRCSKDWNIFSVADGNYFIDINVYTTYGTDKNGSGRTFQIDNTAPTMSNDSNQTWQNKDANVHLTFNDTVSGVLDKNYRIDSDATSAVSMGAWLPYDANIFFNQDGNWAIDYNSRDGLYNQTDTNRIFILIDKNAPIISNVVPVNGSTVSAKTVSFRIQDGRSGITLASIQVDVNGTPSAVFVPATHCSAISLGYNCSYTETGITGNGDWNVSIRGQDLASNKADQNETLFTFTASTTTTTKQYVIIEDKGFGTAEILTIAVSIFAMVIFKIMWV